MVPPVRVRLLMALMACAFSVLCGTHARADTLSVLSQRLARHPDFRVRTQAALALGASSDKRAVEPLCSGLEDTNTTVRAAAAAAIGKLRRGGAACLRERLETESNSSVQSVLKKALARVLGDSAPAITSATQYYLVVGPSTDQTDRAKGEVDELVRRAISTAVENIEGYALAASDETAAQSAAVLRQHPQLFALFLWPKVKKPEYANSSLTVRFEMSIFSYPGKSMKGTLQRRLTMPDVDGKDPESEDQLIQMAAEKVIEELSKNMTRLK